MPNLLKDLKKQTKSSNKNEVKQALRMLLIVKITMFDEMKKNCRNN